MGIIYDDENHTYHLKKKRLGGNSEVLAASGIRQSNNFVSDHDLYVGTASHKAVELHIKGTLDKPNLDTLLIPRVEAYIKFEKATGFVPVATEEIVYSEVLGIATRIDILGYFPNKTHGIIEMKSGGLDPTVGIQTAIQQLCLSMGTDKTRRFGLSIAKNGKPNLIEFTDPGDFKVAMAGITIYNWLRNIGRIK